MADAMTGTTAVDYDQAAYDRLAYFAYRPENYFDNFADIGPTRQSMPGSSVVFTIQSDLALATTPLSETVDVDAVALADSQVTITLNEYGNAVNTTAKLRGTSFVEINPIVANVLGYNAGISIDTLARNIVQAGTGVRYVTGATRVAQTTTSLLTASNVRRAYVDLAINNVPKIGGMYVCMIHPDVALDLREQTGAAAWRDPHTYSQPNEIWNGEIGEFEGFRFISSPRAPQFVGAGAGTTPNIASVYRTLFLGRQALAKVYSTVDGNGPNPSIILSPVIDKLRRFSPTAWYWLGNYGIFRQAAIRGVESSSSVGPLS